MSYTDTIGEDCLVRLRDVVFVRDYIVADYGEEYFEECAEDLAAEFDWRPFGRLAVSLRADGRMYLIDGYLRARAAAIIGAEEVPVILHRDLTTPEREAEIRKGLNDRRPLSELERATALAFASGVRH
jgi:hypothetical protein